MDVRGKKLGGDLRIVQVACCGLGWESFFSRAVDPFNSVNDYVKGCHIRLIMNTYMSYVSGFFCSTYIHSNRRDPRI
jgi:hypothetical protein